MSLPERAQLLLLERFLKKRGGNAHIAEVDSTMEEIRSIAETFLSVKLTIPIFQIILLLFFSVISFLLGRAKLALLVTYVFILSWLFIHNESTDPHIGGVDAGIIQALVFFGVGIIIVLLAIVAFVANRD